MDSCDTNLQVNYPFNTVIDTSFCIGDSIFINNHWYSTDTNFVDTLTTRCDSILIVNISSISINNNVIVNGNEMWAEQIGSAYQWLDCDNHFATILSANNQVFVPDHSGNYVVELIYQSCIDTSSCYFFIVTNSGELSTEDTLILFPNPSNEIINVDCSKGFQIFNSTGQLVKYSNHSAKNITITDLPLGLYTIKSGNKISRFIKIE